MATKDNTVEFFSHDKDMRHDPKINALRIKFPGWGYTVWCMLLETFSDSRKRSIEWNDLNQELLAADFYVGKDVLVDIVDYCVKLGLLQIEDGVLKSQRFQERFGSLDELRETRSQSGKKGADARWTEKRNRMAQNGKSMANASSSIANDSKYSIEENSIEKNRIETSSSFSSSSSQPEEKEFDPEEEQQQQSFVLNFFLRNWTDPKNEFFNKFLPWNNTGGRSWKDMDKDQREAAMLQWQQKPSHPARFTQKFLDMWEHVVYKLMSIAPSEIIWAALDDKIKWEKKGDALYWLYCPECLSKWVEQKLDIVKPILYEHYGKINLIYMITDDADTQRQRGRSS